MELVGLVELVALVTLTGHAWDGGGGGGGARTPCAGSTISNLYLAHIKSLM